MCYKNKNKNIKLIYIVYLNKMDNIVKLVILINQDIGYLLLKMYQLLQKIYKIFKIIIKD